MGISAYGRTGHWWVLVLMGGLGTGGYQCLWEDWALVGISAYGRTGHWCAYGRLNFICLEALKFSSAGLPSHVFLAEVL